MRGGKGGERRKGEVSRRKGEVRGEREVRGGKGR